MDDELAKWNEDLEPIAPMIEYYAREMGQLSGRLMTALSLLTDLEDSYGWEQKDAQTRETVHYSRLLVQSVLRVVASAQADQGDDPSAASAFGDWLAQISNHANGANSP